MGAKLARIVVMPSDFGERVIRVCRERPPGPTLDGPEIPASDTRSWRWGIGGSGKKLAQGQQAHIARIHPESAIRWNCVDPPPKANKK